MAFPYNNPPLLIRPRRSWRLTLFIALAHALAAVVILILPIGFYRIPAILLIVLGAVHAVMTHVLRLVPWSVLCALWQSDGIWRLSLTSGADIEVQLSPATFVSLPLVRASV